MASEKAIAAAWAVIENMSFDETSDKECMRAALVAALKHVVEVGDDA
jgi:hypothetical protein